LGEADGTGFYHAWGGGVFYRAITGTKDGGGSFGASGFFAKTFWLCRIVCENSCWKVGPLMNDFIRLEMIGCFRI